jgi:hypothetical protein
VVFGVYLMQDISGTTDINGARVAESNSIWTDRPMPYDSSGMNMLNRRELLFVAGALAAASCGGARSAADVQTPSSEKLATVTLAVTGMT